MWYREHAKKVYLRSGNMLPELEAESPGFYSVYRFSEETAKEIKASGCSKGFSRYPVYSDRIYFDFDDSENHIKHLIDTLKAHGLGYSVFDSGNRGHHVEVPHTPIYDVNLPYTHRCLSESLGVVCDTTIFQHGRLLRTPGTVHEKSGRKKQLIETVDGDNLLEIAVKQPPESRFKISEVEDSELLPFFLDSLSIRFGKSPGCGRRHTFFWSAAKDAGRAGLSFETTLELLLSINATWGDDSKDPEYVARAVEQGWGN